MSVQVAFGFKRFDRRLRHAPNRVLLLRDGDIGWSGLDAVLDKKAANLIIDKFEEQGADIPIDLHHSTLKVEDDDSEVSEAPAAGWIKGLEYVPGKGLYGVGVEWTDEAKAQIENQEYKYLSPVILLDKESGEIQELHSVALTNRPRTKDQIELLEAAERFELLRNEDKNMPKKTAKKRKTRKTRKVAAQEDTMPVDDVTVDDLTPEDETQKLLSSVIAALQEKGAEIADDAPMASVLQSVLDMLGEVEVEEPEGDGDTEDAEGDSDSKPDSKESAELRIKAASYDKLNDRVKVLEGERREARVDDMIEAQIEAGKILPDDTELVAAARDLAEKNPKQFETLYGAMAPIYEPGKTSLHSGSSATGNRASIIKKGVSEWTNNEEARRTCGVEAWVDQGFREQGLPTLTKAERGEISSKE